ncbi:MAG: NIPSNAP family protein [Gaiellaceae bacterium]
MIYDLRTYSLRPGAGAEFHRIVEAGSVPMLRQGGIEVVAYGPSLLNEERYYLLRAFPSLELRNEQLDAFYGRMNGMKHTRRG